jgi:hypothetical protein
VGVVHQVGSVMIERRRSLPRRTLVRSAAVVVGLGILALALLPAVVGVEQQAIPAEKQAILDRYAQMQADGLANPAPQPTNPVNPFGTPPPVDPGALALGSAAGSGRLVSASEMMPPPGVPGHFTNSWFVIGPPLTATVWAGAASDDPTRSILVVAVWADPRAASDAQVSIIPAPAQAGALTIVGANGYLLSLQAGDGRTFTFDVEHLVFV